MTAAGSSPGPAPSAATGFACGVRGCLARGVGRRVARSLDGRPALRVAIGLTTLTQPGAFMAPWQPRERGNRYGSGTVEGLPQDALVVLIGPARSSKSTFANQHFQPTQVLSSDAFRRWCPTIRPTRRRPPTRSGCSRGRPGTAPTGRLTVVDATNVLPRARSSLLALARRYDRSAVAIVFDRPLETCLAWNATRRTSS